MSSITSGREPVTQSDLRLAPRRGRRSYARYLGAALRYLVLIPLAILFLFPFYIIIRNALITQPEITGQVWQWWPDSPQWSNFNLLFDSAPMATGLRNSAIIALVNLVFQTLFASMAGYALARIPARGRGVAFFIILSTLMVPSAVTFVPTYVVVSSLGGINTLWGIVVPGLFNAFATFLFRQFYLDFRSRSKKRWSRWTGVLWYLLVVILPNSMGIMIALGVLSLVYSWNAFLWPLVVGRSPTS